MALGLGDRLISVGFFARPVFDTVFVGLAGQFSVTLIVRMVESEPLTQNPTSYSPYPGTSAYPV